MMQQMHQREERQEEVEEVEGMDDSYPEALEASAKVTAKDVVRASWTNVVPGKPN